MTRRTPLPARSVDDLTRVLDGVVSDGVAPRVSIAVDHPKYRAWSAVISSVLDAIARIE